MKSKHLLLTLAMLSAATAPALAAKVQVTMNTVSRTMVFVSKATGDTIDAGTPTSYVYNFEAPAGTYVVTGVASNGTTVNGSIEITVTDDTTTQAFKVLTCTAYATNKHADKSYWTIDNGDYTLDVSVVNREGQQQTIVVGNSTTANRKTFLALSGNSYSVTFTPNDSLKALNYVPLYKQNTLTANATISGAIPLAQNYTITVPKDASLDLGIKFTHYIDFTPVEPVKVDTVGDTKQITYNLAQGQIYNYRTYRDGDLTQGGYFTNAADSTKRPVLVFADSLYKAMSPSKINHDVTSNKGYETGDIFVNINPRNHLELAVGDTYKAHAMRSWQLTNNSTNNYFIEPDFHYTVIDLNGNPSTDVVTVEQKTGSAWADLKAVGKGTAIVLVTYDAIDLNFYANTTRTAYMGGEYWGAIWPENTAAYVVTVGEAAASIEPNMKINEAYNLDAKKVAGAYVDAEHDVFYYLDNEAGHEYTFTPTGVSSVTMAYPTIGEHMATYKGFGTTGVTKNSDGSYTLLLKEGRQIVRLTDASGNSTYQVLTAKTCHREITNQTHEGSNIYLPGDTLLIQYSGLRHPANKLAGIYNMSAYITYNGTPNGSSLYGGANQYTFASNEKAQTVTIAIPSDFEGQYYELKDGVIQVTGFGDPIGNHRFIDPIGGRSANFTAIAHKTYFGYVPEVSLKIGTSTGVNETVVNDAKVEGYYNLQGFYSAEPFDGVNIVRYTDGSVKKVFIKK